MAEIGREMAETSGMAVFANSEISCFTCMPGTDPNCPAQAPTQALVSEISMAEGCAWASNGQWQL